MKRLFCVALLSMATIIFAEQSVEFGDWTVHYSVIPSTLISKEVAEKHKIVRGDDRAICNITVVDPDGTPHEAKVGGSFKNLMGQTTKLKFKTIKEGKAVYSLANFKFSDGEKLKFKIEVELPDGKEKIEFEQEVYAQVHEEEDR